MARLSFRNMTGAPLPPLPLRGVAKSLLPAAYEVSVVVVGDAVSRALNRRFRRKDKPANVLAFPLSKTEGELFLNPRQARRDAPHFRMSERTFLLYLVIHGFLHLKGLTHGRTMSQAETRLLKRFSR